LEILNFSRIHQPKISPHKVGLTIYLIADMCYTIRQFAIILCGFAHEVLVRVALLEMRQIVNEIRHEPILGSFRKIS
jgi:hypothetical protein